MSNKAAFWIGAALALPAIFLASMIVGAGAAAGEGVTGDPTVGGVISGILALGLLGGLVTADRDAEDALVRSRGAWRARPSC